MSDRAVSTWSPQALGTFSGTSNTEAKSSEAYRELNIYIRITTVGTTLDVKPQSSPNNSNFFDIPRDVPIPQITATGNYMIVQDGGLGKYARLNIQADGTWTGEILGVFKT